MWKSIISGIFFDVYVIAGCEHVGEHGDVLACLAELLHHELLVDWDLFEIRVWNVQYAHFIRLCYYISEIRVALHSRLI